MPQDNSETANVAIPLWALSFILENGQFEDKGPYGEGWRSDEMIRAIDAVEAAIKVQDGE